MWGARPYGFYLRVFWVGLKPHIIAFLKVAVCRCSTKIGLLKNFVKVTGKHLVFCNKVAGLEPATLFILKKRLQHKCLPVNFKKFSRSFFRLHDVCDIREKVNDLLLRVFLGASSRFLHLYFWIYYISPTKTKTPPQLLARKRYDIIRAREKMTYIDIGYKSAHHKSRQWRKDTKDKEATLI